MEFPFGRQGSMDFLRKGSAPAMERGSKIRSSLTEGSSRLFGSVMAKKNGLFDGISTKIDQVQSALSLGGESDGEMEASEGATAASPQTPNAKTSPGVSSPVTKKPQRPPAPPRMDSRTSVNGGPRQSFSDMPSSPGPMSPPASTINFDEPLYPADQHPNPMSTSMTGPSGRPTRNNPFLNDNMVNRGDASAVSAEVPGQRGPPQIPRVAPPPVNPRASDGRPRGADNVFSGGFSLGGSGGQPRGGGGGGFLAPSPQDLLAITPTSGEALPMPDIEPEQAKIRPTRDGRPGEPGDYYDDSDDDSVATEGCDEFPEPGDYAGVEGGDDSTLFRSGSVGSDLSWSSNDSQLDELSVECMEFMKAFLQKMFDNNCSITQSDKARFGELCQHGPGRLWFSRYVNSQRVHNKKVDEQIFYRLVQFFAVALFECNETEDYTPAKNLMNMCFTFFYEATQPGGPTYKHFLYSYLKEQPIWQSIRFWNAAFFDAVQHERARKPLPTNVEGNESRRDDGQYQENITFGQLGTFCCNMRSFGLNKELCLEFLRKQAIIANLREEQIGMLRENVERWSDQAQH